MYRPRRSIWTIRSRCGCARVLRHSAACSSAGSGVSLGFLVLVVISHPSCSIISGYYDMSIAHFLSFLPRILPVCRWHSKSAARISHPPAKSVAQFVLHIVHPRSYDAVGDVFAVGCSISPMSSAQLLSLLPLELYRVYCTPVRAPGLLACTSVRIWSVILAFSKARRWASPVRVSKLPFRQRLCTPPHDNGRYGSHEPTEKACITVGAGVGSTATRKALPCL